MKTMKDINSGNISALERMIVGSGKTCIVTHMKPDGDAMGSAVAMYRFLESIGKSSRIILNDPYPRYLSFLVSDDMAGNVIIHEHAPAEARKEIMESDLIICLDFNALHRTDRLEEILSETHCCKILIDHHLSPSRELFDLCFSETEVSSASELLYHVLSCTSFIKGKASRLGKRCIEALMTGMTTDTNNFANSVYPSTLHMASALLEAGADRDGILNNLYNQHSENRLRLMGHMMKNLLKITPDGVAYIVLDSKTQAEYKVEEGDTEGFVNMPLSVAQVRMSILAKEDGERIRISVRSKRGTSANQCARIFFNGGGHENAAGGRLYIPENVESVDKVGDYIQETTHIFLNDEAYN